MTTVRTALDRIARLIPTYPQTASPSRLKGDGVWVLSYSHPSEHDVHPLPPELADAQRRRTAAYLAGESRTSVPEAPRYVVWSYGVPIAWVTLDGRTHYIHMTQMDEESGEFSRPDTLADLPMSALRTIKRHRDAIRASWPDRFGIDRDGEPSYGIPGGMRMQEDGSLVPQV